MIDETVRIYGRRDMLQIGHGTRIDAFCVITVGDAGMKIGEHVHLSAGVQVFGSSGLVCIGDGAAISPRVSIFTATDDFAGDCLVGATLPLEHRNVKCGHVIIERCAVVGTGSVVLPGVRIGCGCTVGALSLVKRDVPPGQIVVGPNQRVIGHRDHRAIEDLYAVSRGR